MARSTLGGSGWVTPADSVYNSNYMTGPQSGPVAVNGARFVALVVNAITGGSSPFVQIIDGVDDGGPVIRQVAATPGAVIDQRGSPDLCNAGIWLRVTGNPVHFEVSVLWR